MIVAFSPFSLTSVQSFATSVSAQGASSVHQAAETEGEGRTDVEAALYCHGNARPRLVDERNVDVGERDALLLVELDDVLTSANGKEREKKSIRGDGALLRRKGERREDDEGDAAPRTRRRAIVVRSRRRRR